jgi:hypothetical protein
MPSLIGDLGSLVWYDIDERTNKSIRKILILTPDMKAILDDIWDRGVFYINRDNDYGVPVCRKAIQAAMELEPLQVINYRTIRVGRV